MVSSAEKLAWLPFQTKGSSCFLSDWGCKLYGQYKNYKINNVFLFYLYPFFPYRYCFLSACLLCQDTHSRVLFILWKSNNCLNINQFSNAFYFHDLHRKTKFQIITDLKLRYILHRWYTALCAWVCLQKWNSVFVCIFFNVAIPSPQKTFWIHYFLWNFVFYNIVKRNIFSLNSSTDVDFFVPFKAMIW